MNSKHVKPIHITAKQYLQDQLDKHAVTDPIGRYSKKLEKQIHTNHMYTQNEQLKTLKM